MPNKWIEALKEYNRGKMWCVPRKGTPEHEAVLAIMRGEKPKKAEPKAKCARCTTKKKAPPAEEGIEELKNEVAKMIVDKKGELYKFMKKGAIPANEIEAFLSTFAENVKKPNIIYRNHIEIAIFKTLSPEISMEKVKVGKKMKNEAVYLYTNPLTKLIHKIAQEEAGEEADEFDVKDKEDDIVMELTEKIMDIL